MIARRAFPSGPSHQAEAAALIAAARQANLETWARGLAAIYNRYYRGSYAATSADYVYGLVADAAAANAAATVRRFAHSYAQPSVIAAIPGAAGNASAVVVVSAHYDSIGSTTSGRAPGADDNASVCRVSFFSLLFLFRRRRRPPPPPPYSPGSLIGTSLHVTYIGDDHGLTSRSRNEIKTKRASL